MREESRSIKQPSTLIYRSLVSSWSSSKKTTSFAYYHGKSLCSQSIIYLTSCSFSFFCFFLPTYNVSSPLRYSSNGLMTWSMCVVKNDSARKWRHSDHAFLITSQVVESLMHFYDFPSIASQKKTLFFLYFINEEGDREMIHEFLLEKPLTLRFLSVENMTYAIYPFTIGIQALFVFVSSSRSSTPFFRSLHHAETISRYTLCEHRRRDRC